MDEEVRLDDNESKCHEQLDGIISANNTHKDIVQKTTINGTVKASFKTELNDLNPIEGYTETSGLLGNQKVQTHKPLTFLRAIRGILCLMVLVSTAFMTLIIFAPPAFLLLRLFSVHYSRKVVSFLFGHWLAMWPFLFEKINGTKVVFAGDSVPPRERVLLLCNHRTEVDWMYIWNLALRKDRLGYIKYILKSSVRNAPVFGWGFHVLEFILVERKWEVDEPVIESMLSTFKDPRDPLWLILFPEGTDFTEQKCLRSQRIAKENNLPILKNVLLPRTKGFHSCVSLLRDCLDAVYDLTITYKPRCPLFMDNAFGIDPAEVHIHVRRIPLSEIPTSENEASAWLNETFHFKDQLLSSFHKEGSFPNSGTEEELPTYRCLLNVAVMVGLTVLFSILTFSSIKWIGVYVALSCVYLAAATYFNSRPTPIFGFHKQV
ncbi:probable 1-acyl-sn-glycerol-3-phosphate acyltransferase 4 [Cryptomeria japonica]|uniref:probable 1-acyl-sn-glycerol-3-phosphate acyltransferase 4 n=1 Tax=Cryptomeria japonica TaxID=3369 RepID=UPI0027DA502F|nr:probable 1-acyl-sn-glycerol-3-phosphate acyltransferase 4 [Cryptomeria japonica]